MAKRNKSEFFVATQIELFLVIIFIVFLRASFIEHEKEMLLKGFEDPKRIIDKLIRDLEKAQLTIDSLFSRLQLDAETHADALLSVIEMERQRADSLQKQLTGTGIGNCLNKQLLARIYCYPEGIFDVEILVGERITLYEGRAIEPYMTYRYSEAEFIVFGEDLLSHSKNQYPECRYSVRVYDNDALSKNEFKKVLQLTSKYFYTQLGF